ncbi:MULTISPECIES: hypothetical protein [unclassified Streptomyces]|uniref:hypothetical protein n=1 Tax=unclassified Streptomyces TaxID=2593676 RepID=UPI00093FE533|nr:hypothetical protein [Streptomyces sp. CB01883]OKJ81051.1 hypothetical protein AMK32_25600 [Streptomyces sp. CB01883]
MALRLDRAGLDGDEAISTTAERKPLVVSVPSACCRPWAHNSYGSGHDSYRHDGDSNRHDGNRNW